MKKKLSSSYMFLDEERILKRLVSAMSPKIISKDNKKMLSYMALDQGTVKLKHKSWLTFAAPMVKTKGPKFTYKEDQLHKYAYNPPYGIIPQLASLDPEQLLELANQFSIMKYQYMERGDYMRANFFGWRQRFIERILSRTTHIDYGV